MPGNGPSRQAPRADYKELEKQLPELLAEMSEDLKSAPLIREFVILDSEGNIYNGEGVFVYYRGSHDRLCLRAAVSRWTVSSRAVGVVQTRVKIQTGGQIVDMCGPCVCGEWRRGIP